MKISNKFMKKETKSKSLLEEKWIHVVLNVDFPDNKYKKVKELFIKFEVYDEEIFKNFEKREKGATCYMSSNWYISPSNIGFLTTHLFKFERELAECLGRTVPKEKSKGEGEVMLFLVEAEINGIKEIYYALKTKIGLIGAYISISKWIEFEKENIELSKYLFRGTVLESVKQIAKGDDYFLERLKKDYGLHL